MPEAPAKTYAPALALLVAGAFFMEILDGTVIATALPQMAVSFGARAVDLNVGMSAYLLTLAVFIPASGWVADRFGARSVFCTAICIFTAASILCGISNGLFTFTAARIVQGIGGAMMVPVGRLIVLRNTSKGDLMRAIATITWPGLVAPILGPPLGGFITTYASWRWVFYLNVPLGLIGLAFAAALIPNHRSEARRPLDWIGFALTGLACLALMNAFDLIGRPDIGWALAGGMLAASLAFGILAVRHAFRHPTPLVDLTPLRIPTFVVTVYGGSLFRIAISTVPFLLPLMFQVGFGLDAFASGLLVLAVFAGNLAIKPATSPILRRFGFRRTLIVNGLIAAASIFACALISPQTPTFVTLIILFVGGMSRSMQFTANNALAFADIPDGGMGGANTLFNMLQQMSMGLGIAVGAIALRLAETLLPAPSAAATIGQFHLAFALVGAMALVALIDSLSLASGAGGNVSGHAPPRGGRRFGLIGSSNRKEG